MVNFGPLAPRPETPWWEDRPSWATDEHAWRSACAEVAAGLGEKGPKLDQSGVRRAVQRIPEPDPRSIDAFIRLNAAAESAGHGGKSASALYELDRMANDLINSTRTRQEVREATSDQVTE